MTDERIMRLTEDMVKIYNSVLNQVDEEIWWENIDPAPPKDWRPLCFLTPQTTDLKTCRNWEQTNETEPCLSCPFRK